MRSTTLGVLLSVIACTSATVQSQVPEATTQPPIHVSGGIMAGTILTRSQPNFPAFPQREHLSGATVLHAIIGKDGHVKSLSVISGLEVLRTPVMDAVRQWTYRPYLVNGEPVEVDTTVTLNIDFGGPSASAAPAAPPQGPVRISGGVMAGMILNKVWPVDPPEAREAHVSGAMVLHVIIGKDGHVKTLSVISGPEMLRTAYIDAVRQWTYKPYLLNGEPVEVDTTIAINH